MRFRLLALTAVLSMALAACGGGTADTDTSEPAGDAPAAAAGEVTFVGTADLKWEETSKTVTLGDGPLEVTIECEGAVPHNVALEGEGVDGEVIAECSGDDSGTGTIDVEPGTYTYVCLIPGHREAGMVGEITIE